MNSRQRVRLALNHQEPDRVPMDLGGTGVSTIHLESYSRLLQFLELPPDGLALMSDTFQTAEIAAQVRERLGVDFVGLRPRTPRGWKNVVHSADSFSDEWGIRFQRSRDAGRAFFPSGHPLAHADVTAIQNYRLPDMGDLSRVEGLRDVARKLHDETDYAIIADGMWSLLQKAYDLRGMDSFLMDMLSDEIKARSLLDRLVDVTLVNMATFLKEVGDYVQVVTVADDLGIQSGPIMSLAMYRDFLKPCHKALVEEIRKYTDAKIMLHSDGSIYQFLEDLIQVGFDIINPVQASAKNMDTRRLKREFGQALSFWGGVDTQDILPHGTPADVETEVRRRIDDLAPGGGYILGAVHVIQNDVSPENIYRLFNAGIKYGQYGAIASRTNAAAEARRAFNAKRGGSSGNGRQFGGE
jgi:uroporphyrinogen decarboxylase